MNIYWTWFTIDKCCVRNKLKYVKFRTSHDCPMSELPILVVGHDAKVWNSADTSYRSQIYSREQTTRGRKPIEPR